MKAPDAFRTISEVAEDLDLPQHVLRFWETRFNQIKPMKRGGGRRYYRPEDIDLLRGIRLLLYSEGFTIRGVQRLLKEKGVGFVLAVGQTGSVQTMAAAERAGAAPAMQPHQMPRPAEPEPEPEYAAEPSFDDAMPERPFREAPDSAPPPLFQSARPQRTLSQDARRKIEALLADLLEAKRLLDQVR